MHHARTERIVKGLNAKMRFLAQTKGRREKDRERKRKGKEEEGKEKGKGKLEVKLWQKRKKSQTPQPGIEPGTPANAADALPLSHREKRYHQPVCLKFYPLCQLFQGPIFKGGRKARQDPTNYRPISLTSCVARTMEKLVNNQMLAYLSEKSLLYKHQSGFLPNHSTVTQLCYLTHQWQMALENGEQVHTVFLDLSKAYDRVSIPGLLFKLSKLHGFFKRNFTMDVINIDG